MNMNLNNLPQQLMTCNCKKNADHKDKTNSLHLYILQKN